MEGEDGSRKAASPTPAATKDAQAAPAAGAKGGKDLWQLITAQAPPNAQEQQDTNVLFVGAKGSGKTSLIQKLIRKDDVGETRPTTALEYTHARKEEGKALKVAHFWELGGGDKLHTLVDVVITPENIHTVLVVICCDLGSPNTVWDTVWFWLLRIRRRVEECFKKMSQRQSSTPGKMLQRMQKRFGSDHPDVDRVTFLGIPLLVVGCKWDIFRKEASEYASVMGKTLRALSHSYAASLCYVNTKDEDDLLKYRALMNHLIFGSAAPPDRVHQTNYTQALFVMSGRDSWRDIGAPQGVARPAGFVSCGIEDFDKWKIPYEALFPPKGAKEKEQTFDPRDPAFSEPLVDDMRAVKDDELEQYRQARAKKAQDLQREREQKEKGGERDRPRK